MPARMAGWMLAETRHSDHQELQLNSTNQRQKPENSAKGQGKAPVREPKEPAHCLLARLSTSVTLSVPSCRRQALTTEDENDLGEREQKIVHGESGKSERPVLAEYERLREIERRSRQEGKTAAAISSSIRYTHPTVKLEDDGRTGKRIDSFANVDSGTNEPSVLTEYEKFQEIERRAKEQAKALVAMRKGA